jgi:hypothetical protein
VQLVDGAGSVLRQVVSPFIEQAERIDVTLGGHWAGIAPQRGHTGGRGGVDAVVFAARPAR